MIHTKLAIQTQPLVEYDQHLTNRFTSRIQSAQEKVDELYEEWRIVTDRDAKLNHAEKYIQSLVNLYHLYQENAYQNDALKVLEILNKNGVKMTGSGYWRHDLDLNEGSRKLKI